MNPGWIRIRGARQNNLRNLNLRLPLNELVVVTGVSGCGKSSLAFDTVFAEGQRRYVETFSPYARQFLDRMDRPRVDAIDGIPPAIAIDQINPVRTSRSTVGTMTELNDHLKLLFARAATLHCRQCGNPVVRDNPDSIFLRLLERAPGQAIRALIVFAVSRPKNFTDSEMSGLLAAQGYTRVRPGKPGTMEVIQDRVTVSDENRARLVDSLEAALKNGHGQVSVYPLDPQGNEQVPWRFSSRLHCADCDIEYQDPVPNLFSFNSPIGACPTCRGFGRVIGIDYSLVVPDGSKSLAAGAIKPWQTDSYREHQNDLLRFARRRGIPRDVPWDHMSTAHRKWVLEGEGPWDGRTWYGVKRFFDWLETRSYRMHIRVLLSRYRSYTICPDCEGTRLRPEALLWHLGAATAAAPASPAIHEIMRLPLSRCHEFFAGLRLGTPMDEAAGQLLGEIRARLGYLVEVGLGYLTLDRQSRTLSGGEVQRINLTTALGTSLVNTLFVLDEPTIGLHARDVQRILNVLKQLRDAGNSLLVVEHDPQIMLGADRILDLGPGPGEHGGRVVFFGTPASLLRSRRSVTARYLRGERSVVAEQEDPDALLRPPVTDREIEILGATENNLANIDVRIPLGRMVCVTGVSGSGKSTLLVDICFNALRKLKGHPAGTAGKHRELRGHEHISDAILVDQSAIGKTSRSNPASYVGALEPIRRIFAAQPLAKERGYTAGTFSFNSGNGRCPACQGSGFEHVEMQFLSDVYIRCPECRGRRYRKETLEVKLLRAGESMMSAAGKTSGTPPRKPARPSALPSAASIADVLEMTVSEAIDFFPAEPELRSAFEPLAAVGLSYLKLGQPVPTLSGGEAQRLKLAGHLAAARRHRRGALPMLFIFDEPTTGLHFGDIATLLRAFRRLVAEGHSVTVIEHNLDVIRSADWLIDLGPEGGDEGGTVVCAGTPEHVSLHPYSHTGRALREYVSAPALNALRLPDSKPPEQSLRRKTTAAICIRNAREHNLKGIDITIPRDRFTVITGISGSGKSTVAFNILFAEGQRRYLESLNAYARQFVQPAPRPDVDAIQGIPPTVAIEQRTSRGGRKSTVATLTETYHFLRLLFVKLGVQYCPDCQTPVESQTTDSILSRIRHDHRGRQITLLAPLVTARKGHYRELASWALARGYQKLRVDGRWVATENWSGLDRFREHDIQLPVDTTQVSPAGVQRLRTALERALALGKGNAYVLVDAQRENHKTAAVLYSTNRACGQCGRSFEAPDPRLFSYNSRQGWCPRCYGTGVLLSGFDAAQTGEEVWWNDWWEGGEHPCPDCGGQRLNSVALAVRFRNRSIADIAALPVARAARLFSAMRLSGRAADIARDILPEINARLSFLARVGLGYLALDRAAPGLSGGEAQRIRLAAQLGSNLRGVCYILDEPTIGLHPHDNRMLLKALHGLQHNGNTLVVVEHDEETIRRAQHIIDLGPGAGTAGGRVVAEGTLKSVLASPESITGRCLARPMVHPLFPYRPVQLRGRERTAAITIEGACLNNLRNLAVHIPLGRLVCVSGVSGSGKSTLVRHILHENLHRILGARGRRSVRFYGCRTIRGTETIGRILEVDQTPIGKTPRSCPATYVGLWDAVRRLFSETVESRLRGYTPARFSFNTAGGRCPACEGQGTKTIAMSFLPDVTVSCEVCGGTRFSTETLSVRFKERNIAEVLAMSIDEAAGFFSAHRRISRPLRLLQDVGLGYLTLGQPSPTLSGGEAQRIKLVTELARDDTTQDGVTGRKPAAAAHQTLYVLDEPTVGLHMADVSRLVHVLHRLVSSGNTVVVIEHNLDIIAEADWIIDLGPEGGDRGGRIVAQGPPGKVVRSRRSHTARLLAGFLRARRNRGLRSQR